MAHIINFPSITPDRQSFGISYTTQVSVSSIAGVTQRVEMPGARWSGSASFSEMTVVESATLKAFLLELRGSAGTFYYNDLSHTTPFNPVTGSITIESPSTARVIRTTFNDSNILSVGDYIQIGTDDQRELKMIISVDIVSGDIYDLTIEAMIRRTDYIGQSIIYTSPVGVFMLNSDKQGTWGIRGKSLLSDINVDFIEIFQ